MKKLFPISILFALFLIAAPCVHAEEAAFAPGPEGELQRIEYTFFDAMNKAATTQDMLNAATARYNSLSALLSAIRPQALRPIADDQPAANAFQDIDGSFVRLMQTVMDKEIRGGGTLAPVSASIAGGNIMSAQISLYVGLASGVEDNAEVITSQPQ